MWTSFAWLGTAKYIDMYKWCHHATFTCCFWAPACKNVKIAQRTRQQSHIIEWFPALHMLWKPVKSQILVHLCCVLPFVLPNRHLDDAMLPPEVFERLIDLRQQQERSIQNIEKLRDEHRDWQADSCWSAVYTKNHTKIYIKNKCELLNYSQTSCMLCRGKCPLANLNNFVCSWWNSNLTHFTLGFSVPGRNASMTSWQTSNTRKMRTGRTA